MNVEKHNGRLRIPLGDGGFYYMPNFVRVNNRAQMQTLADNLAGGADYITAVMEFEAKYQKVRRYK